MNEQQIEGGRVVQVEPRFDVPTFLWASPQNAPKIEASNNLQGGVDKIAAARSFLSQYSSRYRLDKNDVATAVAAGIHDPGKGAIIVKFKQAIGGIEVFRDEINVVMNRNLQLIALSGYLTGDNTIESLTAETFQLHPEAALAKAVEDLTGSPLDVSVLRRIETSNNASSAESSAANPYIHFTGDNSTLQNFAFNEEPSRVKKVMFHLPDGYIPAYYVETRINVPSTDPYIISEFPLSTELGYSYVISAADGRILFRNNQVSHNTDYSYRVWADPNTKTPFDTPAGNDVHPKLNPLPDGAQYPFVGQNDVTLSNYPFSRNDPWLPAGATETNGNNVDAFLNLFSPDGFGNPTTTNPTDVPTGDYRAQLSGPNAFHHNRTGDGSTSTAAARQGSIVQLFYNINFLHDWFYDAGFDEASGNSQTNNFGRGGLGNDSMKAQVQDVAGFNNANMLTPADGSRPRMRMYVFPSLANHLDIQSPAGVAAKRSIGVSMSGPQSFDITSEIVIATFSNTPSSCTVTNAAALNGKLAMFDFDNTDATGCSFSTRISRITNTTNAVGIVMAYTSGSSNTVANITGFVTSNTKPMAVISWNSSAPIKTQLTGGNAVSVRLYRAPDRDGALDNQIVFHEWGHYISGRLVGNSNGLNTQQSGGMGEGWGDFLGMLLTVRPEDTNVSSNANWNGVYSLATYATSGTPFNGADNHGYYLGIRRTPYSTDFARNALTFKHIQDGVALPNTAPIAQSGAPNSQVHNTGEIWANMLWECYASLLRDTQGTSPRLTFEDAQGRMKLYLTAAFKMTPVSPTFLEARDALLAAARAYDVTDAQRFAQAFAKRGAGTRAVAPDRYSPNNSGVVESFVTGGDLAYVGASFNDSIRTCDNDGYLDSGEKGRLTITLKNSGLEGLSNTTATISSDNPAIAFPNGNTITFSASQPNQDITNSIVVESAAGLSGIQNADFSITFDDPGLAIPGAITAHFFTRLNVNEIASATATDNVEALNTLWTTGFNAALSANYPWRRIQSSGTVNHVLHGPDGDVASDQYLISPSFTVDGGGSFNLQFDHSWNFESEGSTHFDGGIIEMKVNGGAWNDIGGPIYTGTLTNYTGNLNPLKTRQALVSTSNGTVHVSLTQAIAPGSTVQVRFRIGTDNAVGAGGWNVDNVAFTGVVETPFTALVADQSNCSAPVMVKFAETALPTAYVGKSYTATLTPTGGTAPYNYSIVQPFVLPPGLSYSTVNGNLQISGTPTLRGEYPVTFKITDTTNNQANASYTLSVLPATQAISGLVIYGTTPDADQPKYVSNVVLSFTGASNGSSTSGDSGAYSLNDLNTNGNYVVTPSKTGDINGVTAFDATLVLRHVASAQSVLAGNQLIAADVNNSGSVNAFDATQILRFVAAGVQTPITGESGNWKFSPASRNYTSLSSSPLNDNYTAILMGDVNGDWAPPTDPAPKETDNNAQKRQPKTKNLTAAGTAAAVISKQTVKTDYQSESNGLQVLLPTKIDALPGTGILIPVNFINNTDRKISGFSMSIAFDPALLELDADQPVSTAGTLTNNNFVVSFDTTTPGRIGIASAATTDLTDVSGTLFRLRFKVVGSENAGGNKPDISLTRAFFDDSNGVTFAATAKKTLLMR
ncbi:MAG: M36 family metallopeptidase [Acidobacteriota bacterium]|nr:M36 family metallopeptidase [Acidobacteriota bacterium]